MRLYQKKVPVIAAEIVKKLTAEEDIETRLPTEVQLDLESVMNEYLRVEREITDNASGQRPKNAILLLAKKASAT